MKNLVIPKNSAKHRKFLREILARVDMAKVKLDENSQAWSDAEDATMAYMHETEVDAMRRQNRRSGFSDYTTINVPMSYGMLMSAHTYWCNVFLSRDPILELAARHGEGQQNVLALESLLDYQLRVGQMMVPLFIWLYDMGKYGRGIIGMYWDEEYQMVSQIEEVNQTVLGLPTGKKVKKRSTRRIPGYKGAKIYNVRPQDFLVDPRVTLANLQKGEFCGVETELSWNELKAGEQDGKYFNVDKIKPNGAAVSDRDTGSPRSDVPDPNNQPYVGQSDELKHSVPIIEMYIELIPNDWELGSSKYPEKWVFTLANKTTIIGARPLGLYHNQFPFFVLEYEIEGYNVNKRSLMEVAQPMNDIMTWLVNSHFYNVRKSLNDQFIVDPSKVVMADLLDPQPGKVIRLKPGTHGVDVRSVITQMPTMDVTQNNIREMGFVADMLQRITGINDNLQGVVNEGGRKTAAEIRSSTSFGMNRLKTLSDYGSSLGWAPFTQCLIQLTQQMYDDDMQFKVTRDLIKGEKFIGVSPEAILGFYDFVPVDGTLPVDKFAQAALWKDLLGQMRQMPQLMQQFDMSKIFTYVAQLSGLRNINQFRVNVMDNQQIADQAQAGNLVPVEGGNDATGGYGAGGPTESTQLVPNAPTVGGVGPTA